MKSALPRGLVIILLLIMVAYGLGAWFSIPAEDAVILYRYSDHLAQTGEISYNPGGPPVEGATDFLWMGLIAALSALGLVNHTAALLLSAASLLLSLWLICRIWRTITDAKSAVGSYWLLALLWLGYVLASQHWAAVQGFSVTFWGAMIWWWLRNWQQKRPLLLAISGLIVVLTRPDGLVFVLPLTSFVLWEHRHDLRRWLGPLLTGAVLPGLLYFAWRSWYFGEWLPLPFQVKGLGGDGWFHLDSMRYLAIYAVRYLGPLLLLATWGLGKMPSRRPGALEALKVSLILLPMLFYSTVSLEQNIANRFVLPLLIGSLMAAGLAWRAQRWQKVLSALFLGLSLLYWPVFGLRSLAQADALTPQMGRALAPYDHLRMAVTEAGNLPYYSRWETMDLWGLNHPELARALPDSQLLADFDPDLIMWQDDRTSTESWLAQLSRPYFTRKTWDHMVFHLLKYAAGRGEYERWALPRTRQGTDLAEWAQQLLRLRGRPEAAAPSVDWYLLRRDMPEAGEIRKIFQAFGGILRPFPSVP